MTNPEKRGEEILEREIAVFLKEQIDSDAMTLSVNFFNLPEIQKQMFALKTFEEGERFFLQIKKFFKEIYLSNKREKPDQAFFQILEIEFMLQLQENFLQRSNTNTDNLLFLKKIVDEVQEEVHQQFSNLEETNEKLEG